MPLTKLQEARGKQNLLFAEVRRIVKECTTGTGDLDLLKVDKINGNDVTGKSAFDRLMKFNEIDAEMNDLQPKIDAYAKAEDLADRAKRRKFRGEVGLNAPSGAPQTIGEICVASKAVQQFLKTGSHRKSVEQSGVKADFLRSAGYNPQSIETGEHVRAAVEPTTVIDTIPPGQTTMAVVKFRQQSTRTIAAAERAEGAAYAESSFAWIIKSVNVETIGHLVPVSDEVIADEPTVRSLLDQDMRSGLRERLNSQLITGTGLSNQIVGMEDEVPSGNTQAAKGAGTTVLDYVYDIAENVRTNGWANPNVLYLRSANWRTIRLAKASGLYILGRPDEADPTRIWGMIPTLTQAIAANSAMCIDSNYVQLFQRQGVEVQVGYRNAEFGEGMQTIRAGLRVANAVKRTTALAKGSALNT